MQTKKAGARTEVGKRTKKQTAPTTTKGVEAKLISKSSSGTSAKTIPKKPGLSTVVKKPTVKVLVNEPGLTTLVKKPEVKVLGKVRGASTAVKKPGVSRLGTNASKDWADIVEGASRSVRLGELQSLLTFAAEFDKAAAENIQAKNASMTSPTRLKGANKAVLGQKAAGGRALARVK